MPSRCCRTALGSCRPTANIGISIIIDKLDMYNGPGRLALIFVPFGQGEAGIDTGPPLLD